VPTGKAGSALRRSFRLAALAYSDTVVSVGPRVLVVDNYDSFVYNLVQYLGELGAEPIVHRNDAIDLAGVEALAPDAILISPGPGRPEDAGISNTLIEQLGGRVPILGVCLGHQCIGQVFGGAVVRAGSVMHGKTSVVHHTGAGVLAGLPDPFEATRYHSLVVERSSLPDVLEITAETDDGTIMGLRHRTMAVEGVQFHPESILTEAGHDLMRNFLRQAAPVSP
jgi:anthranilate synthase/aminodeoxychorismate synthase-like glutamine amidotransferase